MDTVKGSVMRGPSVKSDRSPAWHALNQDQVFADLDSSDHGLDSAQVNERLARFGPNVLQEAAGRPAWLRFVQQFQNILIFVLLFAAGVTALLRHWTDTAVIIGVVFINALIGFVQEGKAEHALNAIRKMLSLQATVIRNGKHGCVEAPDLVPGDIVAVQSGDRVPADIRLLRTKNLHVQESALTGESSPVEKTIDVLADDTPLADRRCMAFAGTLVTSGQGTGIVVATGQLTEIGRISTMLADVVTLETPLLRQLAQFSKSLTFAIVAVAALTFGFGVWVRHYAMSDMFIAAVGLFVAAIPEGLPAIMSITLAIGVQRMATRRAIIRKLPAVETLGSVTVICSDKTGTLTRNEMTVQSIATTRNLYEISGVGYSPIGTFTVNGEDVDLAPHPLLKGMARGAMLCSDASVRQDEDVGWVVDGDPTEGALVVVAMKAGLDRDFESQAYVRTDVIPFESEHRFMATLHHDHEGNGYIYVKGAPERILDMCSMQHNYGQDEPLDRAYWHKRMDEIGARGQRVLALAQRRTHSDHRELSFSDVNDDLVLLGFFGLEDPPREEAISAIARCHAAGIQVKMITGDHAVTARAIAEQIGLRHSNDVITGQQIDDMSDAELAARLQTVDVFARTAPEHKLRIVSALQAGGEVVAMTGDGVNDAPALKRADVGVSMGCKGTEAAKEASEMVLVDDNFASIAHAVEEGRTVHDNLMKSITFILPTNGGEAFMIVSAIALGAELPITPLQILWVNMITAVTLALALAFEPAERGVMARPPRSARTAILSRFLVWRIVFVSLILVSGTFGLFLWEIGRGMPIEGARTVAVTTLVLFEVFYLFNTRLMRGPVLNFKGLFGSRAALAAVLIVLVLQLGFVYLEPMQRLFATTAITPEAWAVSALVASTVLFLVEAEKYFFERVRTRRQAPPQR